MYFRSILADKEQRHFYMRDRSGLYPNYPKAETKKLILTESIIDAASLSEQESIKNGYEILSLYGTNGFTEEHQKAISALKELEEVVFFLNGDEPGQKAVAKYAPMLKAAYPNLKITNVELPQNEDVNSLIQGHSPDILTHLISTRKEYAFFLSSENPVEKEESASIKIFINPETEPVQTEPAQQPTTGLNTTNPFNLKYQGKEAAYQIKGFRTDQMDSLKITLQIQIQ